MSANPPLAQQIFQTLHPNLLIGLYRAMELISSRQKPPASGTKIGFYEFGLYQGFSFWYANNLANEMGLNVECHGFDSFEGLPPSTVDIHRNWTPGSYACSLEQVKDSLAKWGMPLEFHLHKGWYSKEYFSRVQEQFSLPPPGIALIDCDIYESAREVLLFLDQILVRNTILLFDDYNAFGKDPNHGERKALAEYESSHPRFRKEHLFSFGPWGEAFQVVDT
jgi:hypothetical protein